MTEACALRGVASRDDLLALTDHDPFVAYDVSPTAHESTWVLGRAVAIRRLRQSRTQTGLSVVGPDDDTHRLLHVLPQLDLSGIDSVSVDRHRQSDLEQAFGDAGHRLSLGGRWDWMWTTTSPPRLPEEDDLTPLDDRADAPDILALHEIGNPTAESQPGEGRSERWVGCREGGTLVAAAAMQRTAGGIPHLCGITVAPSHRGRHLGLAMTATLTRYAVQAEGICSLGMYADNDVARGVYTRLGYRVAHSWSSMRLTLSDQLNTPA